MSAETEGEQAVRQRADFISVSRGLERRVVLAVAGVEVDAQGIVRAPPVEIVQRPQRRGISVADILPAPIGVIAGFFDPVMQPAFE